MDVGSILMILAITILTAVFIARPVVEGWDEGASEVDRRVSALKVELEQALALLQEMEMDRAMEKIAAEDYEPARAPLVARAAELMRAMDEMQGRYLPADEAREAEIEAAVMRRRSRQVSPPGYCTQCGTPLRAGDRFCGSCGAPVQAQGMRA